MGTVSNVLRLTLGQEDALGRVFAGSTGRGLKTLYREARAAEGSTFKNLVEKTATEVDRFTSMTSEIDKLKLDKSTLKALKKSSGNMKTFWQNMKQVIVDKKSVSEVFTKASSETTEALAKKIATSTDDLVEQGAKTGLFSKIGAAITKKIPALGKLKGKGGTLGIVLAAVFEIPTIIKAFKNGDGLQQIGRSTINMAGCAAGAAAGAAIGSIIPGAGTLIGGLIGGVLGFAGSILGGDVAKKVGDGIFGKSIEEKKEEAAAVEAQTAETQTQTASTPSLGVASESKSSYDVPKYLYGYQPVFSANA